MPSKSDRFAVGQRLTKRDLDAIVARVINSLRGGGNNLVSRTSREIAVSSSGHQIIPISKGGGLNIINAANKAALDLVIVAAPNLGWTEDTEILYERSEDGLTWLPVNRWREYTL